MILISSLALAAPAAPVVLSAEVERARAELAVATPQTCELLMDRVFTSLERLQPEDVDRADVAAHGAQIVEDLFEARVQAQEMLRAQHEAGTLTRGCVHATRRADLASRYLADHLLEALAPEARPSPWLTTEASGFTGPADLRSGDVLVTRYNALASAGIAHMGEIDSQFSHNVLIYVDPQDRAWTVEAYLEQGAIVQPLEDFLADHIGRIVVLRHTDAELATRAASAAYARITEGRHVPYDGTFDSDDPSRLFCSEVPRWAFGPLLGLPPTVPLDLTTFQHEATPHLFDAMGIAVEQLSAPADVLYDPRFDVVAEWRDVAQLPTLRQQDAVVEAVLSWMSDEAYTLQPGMSEQAMVRVGKTLRGTPLIGLALRKTLSRGLDRDFLVASLTLQNAALQVEALLVERLGGRTDHTRDELLATLEALRLEDLEVYAEAPRRSAFHRRLHPRS